MSGLTYAEMGATRDELPPGYRHLRRRVTIGSGRTRFDLARHRIAHWEMHRRAGVRVRTSADVVSPGAMAVLRLGPGPGPLGIDAPVEVVYVIDEPGLAGFAYGTLPGHPECGEEAFVVELHEDESVTFAITAFSRPASWLTRLAGPAGRLVQQRVTERYLRSA